MLQVIKVNNLHLASKLHVSEQTWTKTAEHFTVFLMSKVKPDPIYRGPSVNLNNVQNLNNVFNDSEGKVQACAIY